MERTIAQNLNIIFLNNKIVKVEFVDLGDGAWRWIFILDDGSVIMLPVHPTCPVDFGKKTDIEFINLMSTITEKAQTKLNGAAKTISGLME